MRLATITSIAALAVVVLMALACTAAPAPDTSDAFSCQELADTLAEAQTETAARVLTESWNESGCAHKVAGVTKTPIPDPTHTPTWRPQVTPTPRPDYQAESEEHFANAQLATLRYPSINYDRLSDVLRSYSKSPEAKEHSTCASNSASSISHKDESAKVYYRPTTDTWLIKVTGTFCKGIEKFEVEDNTGKVTYLGSSLD